MFRPGEQTEVDNMKRMSQLLQKLSQRDIAAIFKQPVIASEYPDYHQIVSTPMDLGTIQENIRCGRYSSLEACAKDVRIVWTNAYLYNPPGSIVAENAHALSKMFEVKYNDINPSDFNYAREPNYDERHKFSRDIYRVEDSQLLEAVELLEKRCPEAVVRNNDDGYFVVKVDALPAPVFWEVELYLRKRLRNKPERTKKKIATTRRPAPESMARLSGRKRRSSSSSESGGGSGDSDGTGSNQEAREEYRAVDQATTNGDKGRYKVGTLRDAIVNETIAKRTKRMGRGGDGLEARADTGDNLRRSSEGNSARDSESAPPSWTGQTTDGLGEGGIVEDIVGAEGLYGDAVPDGASEVDFTGWLEDPVDTSFREGGGAGLGISAVT